MASYEESTSSYSSTSNRTLSAFFDERDDAQEAVDRLRALGIPEGSVRLTGGDGASSYSSSSTTSSTSYSSTSDASYSSRDEHKGFWESLGDFFFPDEDRATYAEGLRRGGYLVTVSNVPDSMYDQALDILDDEGSVDLDQRSSSWRSEGWDASSYSGTTSTGTLGTGMAAGTAMDTSVGSTDRSFSSTSSTDYAVGATGTATGSDYDRDMTSTSSASSFDAASRATDDEVIPVVEERLRIGKRVAEGGRVRVRSYVVEEPVSEQVNLREERVHIERRPVDRALSGTEAAFTDKVIEAEERVEEAVVAKEARVVEEIGIRKEAEERTETVSDTVRHTEVEVEDERAAGTRLSDVRVNEDRNR